MSKLIIKKQYSPEPRDIYFTVPNFISLLRIISIPLIAMLVARHEMVSALVVLALSAVSDGLDGLIARSFNQVLHLCGLATGIWGVGLYWLAGYIYIRQGIGLLRNDGDTFHAA